MRRLGLVIVALALAGLVSSGAWAQSAKFDAEWSNVIKSVKATIVSSGSATCSINGGGDTTADPCVTAEATIATIHVPQQKDLLIGVSAQIGLVTLTQARGKKGVGIAEFGQASAEGSVTVRLELHDADSSHLIQLAAPGPVIFAKRLQELKVSSDTDTDVIVSLKLATTAAHHFNFLGIDLPQGTYDVVAVFDLSAMVAVVGLDAIAEAEVILGPRMVTAQEVRAVRGGLDNLPECNDGFDNDDDGKIDLADPDCTDSLDNDESS